MILVTGPTGGTGSLLIERLRRADIPFRAMVRREDAFEQLKSQGHKAVVMGDFDKPETLTPALDGISRAYLVCTPDEQLADRECRFVDAAAAQGIDRVVKLSAMWADSESPSPNLRAHHRVEEHLKAAAPDHSIIRPHGFFQTVYWMNLPGIQAEKDKGVMAAPAGDGKAPYLDIRDVVEVAFRCLTEDQHANQTYEITGPEALSMSEIAAVLGAAMGKSIMFMDIPEAQMEAMMRSMGVAESSIAHVSAVFKKIRQGQSETVFDTLQRLGIEPRTWRDFSRDLQTAETGAATSFEPPAPQ